MVRSILLSFLFTALFPFAVGGQEKAIPAADGIQVPDGFEVTLFADNDLAHDIYSMTLDTKGRVVVSSRGYVRTLIDDDGDGKADRFTTFAEGPATGAQGLCFDGHDLLCVAGGGVLRYRDRDGDGRADQFTDFATKQSLTTGIVKVKGGIIVAQAPDMVFLQDTDGDDVMDEKKVLFGGFGIWDTHAGPANLPPGKGLALQKQNRTPPAAELQRYHGTGGPSTHHHHVPEPLVQTAAGAWAAGHDPLHLRMKRIEKY